MKKREGIKYVIHEPAKSRIERNECPSCGKPKKDWNRRTDWRCCSTKCTEKYEELYTTYSQADMREKVLKRDKYKCVKCGYWSKGQYHPDLEADHITPIALGGDEWDLDNLQTLCNDCHRIKTKEDIRKIAQLRKIEKLPKEQSKLNNH